MMRSLVLRQEILIVKTTETRTSWNPYLILGYKPLHTCLHTFFNSEIMS